MSIVSELRRRNVFRVGIAYVVVAWVLLQVFDVIGEILELPTWSGKLILAMLVIGFFIALIGAWCPRTDGRHAGPTQAGRVDHRLVAARSGVPAV